MAPKPKRPVAVWIAVILLLIYAVYAFAAIGYVASLLHAFPLPLFDVLQSIVWRFLPVLLAMIASLIAVPLILQRRNSGRWIAIAAMCVMMGHHLYVQFSQARMTETLSEWALEAVAITLGTLPNVLIIALLTIGKRTNAYFRKSATPARETVIDDAPPPPIFES